jgi:Putative DNA-binding domain
MSDLTFLDALVDALGRAAQYNQRDQARPAAILWPDRARSWETLIPRLRERLPVLTFGPYAPEELRGPAAWLRCMVARTLPAPFTEEATPIIFLPGVSTQELQSVEHCPKDLQRLIELRYRSVLWSQRNGHDWTVADFLQSKEGGLGIEVRTDAETIKALHRSLLRLADQPIARLRAEAPWRTSDFDALLGYNGAASQISIVELIARGESADLEFKSTARWNVRAGRPDKEMEKVIVKTVAAFLNSERGGTLLIGVQDDGTILGLDNDYQAWSKPADRNRDKYELWLMGLLLGSYGKEFASYISVTFHDVGGRDVCKTTAYPAHEPVYAREKREGKDEIDEIFYLRTGNATNRLTIREAIKYIQSRWK